MAAPASDRAGNAWLHAVERSPRRWISAPWTLNPETLCSGRTRLAPQTPCASWLQACARRPPAHAASLSAAALQVVLCAHCICMGSCDWQACHRDRAACVPTGTQTMPRPWAGAQATAQGPGPWSLQPAFRCGPLCHAWAPGSQRQLHTAQGTSLGSCSIRGLIHAEPEPFA